MKLTPRDLDRLTIFTMAELARRRMGRGRLLGHPESIAYICDEVHEAARDGLTYEEVVAHGLACLTTEQVMSGISEMIPMLQLEVSFADGTKLVTLRRPIR